MSDKLKAILPPKRKTASILAISFASAFTLFLYTPLDMYLNNPTDFVVSWRFLLPPLLVAFLLCFIAISIVLTLIFHKKTIAGVITLAVVGVMIIAARFVFVLFSAMFLYMLGAVVAAIVVWVLLLRLLKEEALTVVILGMWGVLVAAYIQTLFLNGNMVAIMGQQTEYGVLTFSNIINALIWFVIIVAPLCIWLLFKVKKKHFRYEKAFVLSLVIISGMQIVGLISTTATTDLPEGYDQNPVYFTYDAAVEFNQENNVLVFVLDTLDVRVIRHTFEAYPHLWDYLDGFTLYENNVAQHFGTIPSLVSMLTGHHKEGPWVHAPEYKPEAWAQHGFIDTLRDNGFRTNLYLCLISAFSENEQIEHRADNMRMPERVGANIRPLLSTTTRLSLGRLSPYVLKNTWLSTIAPDFGSHFFYIEVENEDAVFIPVVGIHSDMRFHRFITQAEFSVSSEESVFTFIFLNGPHANGDRNDPGSNGFHFDEESGEIWQGGSRTDVVRANFETLNFFFNEMKEIGVYDNTTIIITGDHGLREQIPDTVSLFIKPKNSIGSITVDTTTELSHINFQASILEAAGVLREGYGISYFDIINGVVPPPQARIMYVLGKRHNEPHALIEGDYGVWEIVGDANNRENWTFVPRDYYADPIR
ncbi:MAG: sulfatase-like hydrolase/transferase [Oscillospiraceae bacterium]|nr:sulfatase-like hydrolase/transferase [Oscillospiraceae bacterium]